MTTNVPTAAQAKPLTAEQEKRVEEMLNKAKTQLVLDHPFFASLLLRKPLTRINTGTLGVDKRGNIYYNPRFIIEKNLTVRNLVFGLAHEVMHAALLHFPRMGTRNQKKWNYAGDAVINDTLREAGVGDFIDGGVEWAGGRNESTEEIYAKLPESDGGGEGPGGIGDDFVDNGDGPLSESEMTEIEATTKTAVAQAAQAARMQGKLPANIARMVDALLEVKTPWYYILERFMVAQSKADYSWKSPNRRFAHQGIYLPSLASENAMGELVVVVDTSGSIGDRELSYFGGHLNRILETCRPEKTTVIYCDAAVAHVDEFSHDEMPVALARHGGGGTDMREAFNYVTKKGMHPDCAVLFTDGYTPWPQSLDYPLVTLCTTDVEVPIGEVVRFLLDD